MRYFLATQSIARYKRVTFLVKTSMQQWVKRKADDT